MKSNKQSSTSSQVSSRGEENVRRAEKSLRTIALAYREIQENSIEDPRDLVNYAKNLSEEVLEQNMTLIAIVGIQDPIRPDVISSVQQCRRSGITVRMVTGDNLLTA